MSRAPRRGNNVTLRHGMTIGSNSAETDDEFLFKCFVHYPPVDSCERIESPGMVLAGRTGAGKTAILRYIASRAEHIAEIDPMNMAMNYVSNSDALNFLQAIGADLDLFFQVLWKHVLCIEFIRMCFGVLDEEKSKTVFSRVFERFSRDPRKEKSLKYLRDWEGRFWITMDENIKEITEKVETRLNAEMGGEISKFKARGQYEKQLSSEKKLELVARARKIINGDQLMELAGVIDMLSDQGAHADMRKYYILVDKLDERWVDITIRFRLIRGLIESLKAFRKIRNLKIVVALRADILERVVQETADVTFQREKMEDYFVKIKWTKDELKNLVNKRILELFRRQYTGSDVYFDDLFAYKVGGQHPFDYMIERTLYRPRDIISFVNQCLSVAEGDYEITAKKVHTGEIEYSRIRRDAMEQEWQSAFPTLRRLLDHVTSMKKVGFTVEEMAEGPTVDQLILDIVGMPRVEFDPLYIKAAGSCDLPENNRQLDFMRDVVAVLYRVGAVGLRLRAGERISYAHIDEPLVSPVLISGDTKVRVHPMLHAALKLREA